MDELTTGSSRVLQDDERSSDQKDARAIVNESYRTPIKFREDERSPRQTRRWDGNGRHKSRGSLLSRQEDIIHHQPKVQDVKSTFKPRVQKAKKSLRINPDINIPSTVSVGNFARLLSVSLGKANVLF
jgi:hypothetical protein